VRFGAYFFPLHVLAVLEPTLVLFFANVAEGGGARERALGPGAPTRPLAHHHRGARRLLAAGGWRLAAGGAGRAEGGALRRPYNLQSDRVQRG
jgi:hypothetical protein